VKAPIPRKQGLKLGFFVHIFTRLVRESAHSKKTRIETQLKVLMELYISKCESAHSKKTRIETIGCGNATVFSASESAHSKKTRIETRR